ncbi:MAG: hypothetical protein H0X41_08965, partial [Chitinophagaceae bacterium]|nr:hypothetical protein [Chitinophagaceae bacterium]
MNNRLNFMQGFRNFLLLALALCVWHLSPAQDIASLAAGGRHTVSAVPAGEQYASMSLEKFMQKFQRVYNIYFSYETDALKGVTVAYPTSADRAQTDPDVLLKKVLVPAGLTYDKVNDVYIIKRSAEKKMVTEISAPVPAGFPVKGHVYD